MINTVLYKDIPNVKTQYDRAIAFLLSEALFEYQGVMILNLLRTNKDNYDVIVLFEYDLTAEQKEFLVSIEPRCIFIHYIRQDFFDELTLTDDLISSIAHIPHVHTQFGKHVIFKLLSFCNKVLLLEQDMIINGDISEIFLGQGPAIAFTINFENHLKKAVNCSAENLKITPLPSGIVASNGGLYYVDRTLPFEEIYNFILDFKRKLILIRNALCIQIDELAISYSLFKYSQNVRILDSSIYNTSPILSNNLTKIVHCKLGLKQSSIPSSLFLFPYWIEAYKQWLFFGGNQIKGINLDNYPGFIKNSYLNENLIKILFTFLNLNISSLKLSNNYNAKLSLNDLYSAKNPLNFIYNNRYNIEFLLAEWNGFRTYSINISFHTKSTQIATIIMDSISPLLEKFAIFNFDCSYQNGKIAIRNRTVLSVYANLNQNIEMALKFIDEINELIESVCDSVGV